MKEKLLMFTFFCSAVIFAQTTIKGRVFDTNLEPLAYISITAEKGSVVTDEKGNFTLFVKQVLPLKIKISGVGYKNQTIEVKSFEGVSVVLEEKSKLQEVVRSASRTLERVLESPVTIERVGENDFKNATSVNFYEDFVNLKALDVLNNSSNIKNIVSNRGFANTENTRFVQLVDGIESTLPLFNYSLGNTFGVSELDIATAEILPGASSALYGPNALNGILIMTSKSPFDHQGISTYFKSGVTTQDDRASKGFYDVGIRLARAFGDKFAAKANFTYQAGEEWHATDYRNTLNGDVVDGERGDIGYNGVNVYGDEVDANLVDTLIILSSPVRDEEGNVVFNEQGTPVQLYTDLVENGGDGQGIFKDALFELPNVAEVASIGNVPITRRGYNEIDLIDTGYKSAVFSSSLNYRPWANDKLEIIGAVKYSLSDNIVHGSNRLKQTDALSSQYALEFKGKNFFVKGYYTEHDTNLVDPNLIGQFINTSYMSDGLFFGLFSIDYVNALLENGGNVEASLAKATQSAVDGSFSEESLRTLNNPTGFALGIDVQDVLLGQPKVGTDRFNRLVTEAKNTSVQDGGASLKDRSGLYHVDANYNFKGLIEALDVQVGGSFREYRLNSNGEIFSDADSPINYQEFGVYTQLQKKFANDRIKASITGRYDKSQNFDGNFSPRASITYAAGKLKNHNFRFSFQTGFRNPTTQDQYAAINLGQDYILGSTEDNLDRFSDVFDFNTRPGESVVLTGNDVVNNSFTASSVENFLNAYRQDIIQVLDVFQAPGIVRERLGLLEAANVSRIKPETVQTLELGYRASTSLGNNVLEIDAAAFYSVYQDLIAQTNVITPFEGASTDEDLSKAADAIAGAEFTDFTIRTNSNVNQIVYGFSTGVTTKVFGDFNLGLNYSFSKNEQEEGVDEDETIENTFNTPEHSVKLSFGHDNLFKNFGFKLNGRWQDEFLYNSAFVDAIIESRTVLDAQVNYRVPTMKSTFKIGGTNLGGKNYTSVPGSGLIGSQYYVSWTINN